MLSLVNLIDFEWNTLVESLNEIYDTVGAFVNPSNNGYAYGEI